MARYWLISLFLILLLVGCGPPASEVAESEPQLGELEKDGDFTYGEPIVEWVRVLNCDNPLPRSDFLRESRGVERNITWSADLELGGYAGIGAGVEGKIATGYQLEVSEQIELSREIELPVQAYSSVEYPIEWQTLVWSGRLPFKLGSAEGRIRYFYTRYLFGEVVDGFRDRTLEDCGATTPASPTTPSETPIHTPVPEQASVTPTPLASPPLEPIESPTATSTTTQASPLEQSSSGEIASDVPGTPLQVDVPVSSVVDRDTKPRDIYSINLAARDVIRVTTEASNGIYIRIVMPGALTIDDGDKDSLCVNSKECAANFNVATSGTYYVEVRTDYNGVAYTLHVDTQ